MSNKKLIIFDFDGTIADTIELARQISNELATEFSYNQISPDEVLAYRSETSQGAIKKAGISLLKLPFIAIRFKQLFAERLPNMTPIQDIFVALQEVKQAGFELGIVTSNSKKGVQAFLEKNNFAQFFSFIRASSSIFGKSRLVNEAIKASGIEKKQVVYIGDETRDIEAARSSKIAIIAVTWGFNTKERLISEKPDYMIDTPSELLDLLQKI
ncbi:MAG: HAD family hydrolase [Bacteroidetes bacterium]|nr:MAG: HAD family hydrolase [Bacteroidota bacterium]